MTKRLEGKVAVVTGASRGIGEAIATAFAQNGAKVVVASRKQPGVDAAAERINELVPGSAFPKTCHIGKADQVTELIRWTEAEIGLPQILVNNAATNPYFGPLLGASESIWDKTFEVNLKGVFEPSRQVAQRLIAEKLPGSIINVSSIVGMRGAPFQGIYGMTKAAVISMTQTLAVELGASKIRINAIAPGLVETKLAATITSNDNLSKYFTDRAPLGRYAVPEELAGLALFLASDESSYVTGQTICVDGGWTAA